MERVFEIDVCADLASHQAEYTVERSPQEIIGLAKTLLKPKGEKVSPDQVQCELKELLQSFKEHYVRSTDLEPSQLQLICYNLQRWLNGLLSEVGTLKAGLLGDKTRRRVRSFLSVTSSTFE